MSQQSDVPDSDYADGESGFGSVAIRRYKDHVFAEGTDQVAHEVPVALVFNGISHAVMLASPLDLTDFAIGFSFSEGIIEQRADVFDIEQIDHPGTGIEIQLTIAASRFAQLKERRRTLVGRTGCGLCGLESLTAFESALQIGQKKSATPFVISQSALFNAFKSLQSVQPINAVTGSMHAAAWVNSSGEVLMVREDLGRHNALDKLIGALLNGAINTAEGCVIMTSRASYELAQKTARANIPLLATISAPTSLAIQVAERNDLSLVGFVRNLTFVVYSHPERIKN
jgi:formate dehydrogenase accessory protein FdhD